MITRPLTETVRETGGTPLGLSTGGQGGPRDEERMAAGMVPVFRLR